jgi:EAL domain-containing protein (putative c-di-GMP-specific phosphodiesterase class I)/sensor domain CHASE-containing protein
LAKDVRNAASNADAGTPAPGAERFLPFGRKPLRTFALTVGLPAFLLYVSSAILVILALVMMAREIDRLEDRRGITAMHAALDSFLNGLSDAVADEGTWNEAHLNVVVVPDPAWMDSTWGSTARLGSLYDDVMVTDQNGLIVFGENNLGAIRGNIAARYPAAKTMLRELDKAIASSGDAAVISHFASDNKAAAGLAAVSIHKATPGEMTVPRQSRRILWIAKHITPSLLQDIAVRYQTPLAEMVTTVEPDSSAIDIADIDGKVAGTVAWVPDRPGEAAFRHALLIVSFVFFGIGLFLVLGLGFLRRAMVRRAAKIEVAFAEHTRVADVAVATAAEIAAAPIEEEEPRYSAIDGVSASDFTVEYQPVFDLRSETMIGVEALLRWTKADKTPLLQEQLTPVETAAMMERLAIIVLRHATGELAPLLGVVLTISVTPDQLQNSVFAEKVAGTLGATNFQGRRLQLSVDTSLLPAAGKLAAPLAEIRQMGVSIALSNFTLGGSTIDYLKPGFADRICLAPSLIAGIDADPVRMKLAEATVEAARSVSFAVTVPGIERKEEAAKLLRLGCREFRGPLLAKPMSAAALTSLILAPAKPQERKAG